jgi:nitrate reductase gamma subunit
MSGLQIASYVSVLFFIVVIAAKMVKIARMPVHLRWDLYPIPHEKGRNKYGGSYFEDVDWWTKPKHFSLIGELSAMLGEIVFVKSVYEHNRPLWYFSFPFHFGMYCLIGFIGMLALGAVMGIAGVDVAAGSGSAIGVAVFHVTRVLATAGWILSSIGAIGLFFSRLLKRQLRVTTVLSDYVNLLFLLAVFVTGYWVWTSADPNYSATRAYVQSWLTFQPAGQLPAAMTVQLWVTIALLFYFPFTHMTHMVGKYFTYHRIRWEDAPNLKGSKIEHAVEEALGYKVTWSAPHVKTGSTWAEAATAPEEKDKNE